MTDGRGAVMSTEHIKFITVGFAEMINSLPTITCVWCGATIENLRQVRTINADITLCGDWCYTEWAADQRAEDDAEYGLDYRDE